MKSSFSHFNFLQLLGLITVTEPSKYIVDGAPENTELMSAYKFQKDVSGGNKLMENNLALVSHTHHNKKSVVKFL